MILVFLIEKCIFYGYILLGYTAEGAGKGLIVNRLLNV